VDNHKTGEADNVVRSTAGYRVVNTETMEKQSFDSADALVQFMRTNTPAEDIFLQLGSRPGFFCPLPREGTRNPLLEWERTHEVRYDNYLRTGTALLGRNRDEIGRRHSRAGR